MPDPILRIENAQKSLGETTILNGLNLDLYCGRVSAVLGPSGAGKSTLLRAIAGLERLDQGRVSTPEGAWDDAKSFVPANKRRVGVVFQDYALFPHLTVEKNIGFGLTGLMDSEKIAARVESLLYSAELTSLAKSFPHELSGGEQQRVALARALAPKPDIVLLDEPFSSLDRRLRTELRAETLAAIKTEGAAALLVTHDSEEAFEIADELLLMEKGQIVQRGLPADVYIHPASLTCARLLGDINVLSVKADRRMIDTPFGQLRAEALEDGKAGLLLVRPEGVIEAQNGVKCDVIDVRIRHGRLRLRVQGPDGASWMMDAPLSHPIKKGESLALTLDKNAITILPD